MKENFIVELKSRVSILSNFAKENSLNLYFSLSSSIEISEKPYFGGVRTTNYFVIASIINVSQEDLDSLAAVIDKSADAVFVDVEKKHPFYLKEFKFDNKDEPLYSNLISGALDIFKKSEVIPWSSSRATSESTIKLLRSIYKGSISGIRTSVIGIGSIGFKVALYLVEEGCDVIAFNKKKEKANGIVDIINSIKSKYTIANASYSYDISTAMASAPITILAANDNNYIDIDHLRLMPGNERVVIDISKNSLSEDAKKYIYKTSKKIIYKRVDIGEQLSNLAFSHFFREETKDFTKSAYKKIIRNNKEFRIISCGFPGSKGDYVVDNVNNPKFILGKINSNDSFESYLERF